MVRDCQHSLIATRHARVDSIGAIDDEHRHAANPISPCLRIGLLHSTTDRERREHLVEICRRLGASVYLAQRAAAKYLDHELFRKEGIKIQLINPPAPIYPQLWGAFVSNLSTFDMLLNCGPKARDILNAD